MNYIEKEFFKFTKANQLKFIFQADGLTYKADFYSKKFNLIVNINGCFWHNHGCINSKIPKKNTRYWLNLFEKNKARDCSWNQAGDRKAVSCNTACHEKI